LVNVNFTGANLSLADLSGAILKDANLTDARLWWTRFSDKTNLTDAYYLDENGQKKLVTPLWLVSQGAKFVK